MSVSKTIPRDSRYLSTATGFQATFNVSPYFGQYYFQPATNTKRKVIELNPHSVYLLERTNLSGDLPEDVYREALRGATSATLPYMQLFYKLRNIPVFARKIPLINFLRDKETVLYVYTEQNEMNNTLQEMRDELQMTVGGVLAQPAELVGETTVNITISFDIYEIIEKSWIKQFKSGIDKNIDWLQ